MERYAVGFARPDRWKQRGSADESRPWHAVEARRPASELDGEIELAVCGAIVQVWGWKSWERTGTARTTCAECQRLVTTGTTLPAPAATPQPTEGRRLRVVS